MCRIIAEIMTIVKTAQLVTIQVLSCLKLIYLQMIIVYKQPQDQLLLLVYYLDLYICINRTSGGQRGDMVDALY